MGSTEPHGPHLPLDTDAILAAECGRRTGHLLEAAGVPAVVLPTIPYGVTRLAQEFDGGVTLRPGTLWSLVEDVLLSLQQDGVRQLVICNAHHEYEHDRILRNICTDYCRRGEGLCQAIFPERKSPGPNTTEEDCFGGMHETSMMLAASPQSVDWERVQSLEDVEFELPKPCAGKNRSLLEMGLHMGYIGAPRRATKEMGERLLAEWAQDLVGGCVEVWPDLFESS
ncbi:MAG: creatinine amidohydrolase [Candidatus Paceibacteria bacterium]|jgi:creatinine amidohydrolase